MSVDPGGLDIDTPQFRNGSRKLGQSGSQAGQAMSGGVNAYDIGDGNSFTGHAIRVLSAGLQGGVAQTPGMTSNGGLQLDQSTNGALNAIQGIDQANAALINGDPSMDPNSNGAQDEAKKNGDQTDQQMQQILQEMMQAGMQAGQQIPQQIQQLVQQLNQGMNQVVQQVSQFAQQAAGAAAHAATPAIDAASALGNGLGAAGGAGAAGATMPAGLEEPVTPMTTSPALVQGTGPIAPAAGSAGAAAGSRMPMMPMMPMHGKKDDDKNKRKRDPNIFPEGRLYDPPVGTLQNFGANPEIDSAEPPFGTTRSV
jgi:uncharacterized membrane protein